MVKRMRIHDIDTVTQRRDGRSARLYMPFLIPYTPLIRHHRTPFMPISSAEHTQRLLDSMSLTKDDLAENHQGRLSERQRTRSLEEAKWLRYGSAAGIIGLLALFVWGTRLAQEATTDQTANLVLLSVFVIGMIAVCLYVYRRMSLPASALAQASVTKQEGPVKIDIRSSRERRGYPYVTMAGGRVHVPRQTALLMTDGLRYRVFTHDEEVVSVEALDSVAPERLQETAQALATHRDRRLRFIGLLFLILAIPVALDVLLNFVSALAK